MIRFLSYCIVLALVHPGGEIRDIHVVGHAVLSPSGDLVRFAGTVIYGTGCKRTEKERERLRQAQLDLAHVSRSTTMGELAASLAHEDQPIATAFPDPRACLRWLGHDQPDQEEARQATESIWDFPFAGLSLIRTAAACNLPATLDMAQGSTSYRPLKWSSANDT